MIRTYALSLFAGPFWGGRWSSSGLGRWRKCRVGALDAEHRLKAPGELYAAPPVATVLTPFFLFLLLSLVKTLPG